jgi:hypothetical protein
VPGSWDRPLAPDQPDSEDMPRQLRTASSRSDLPPKPDRPDEARPADRQDVSDQPVSWSRADMRQRLERLPPGHPSAPPSADLGRNQRPSQPESDLSSARKDTDQDSGGHPDEPDREPDAGKSEYWGEVPGFLRAQAEHVRRWPDDRVASVVDRSLDPAGSWRGDGGQQLSPEQHAQSKDVIARMQRTEEALTKRMGDAEQENACGGWLAGLEFCRKGEDRLKEKIADSLKIAPAKTPIEVMREIPDAIRYTFCFEPDNYSDGYWNVKQRLEARGYQMIYSKNHWRDDPEYKGINTRWLTQDGDRFEVQFHTPESFHAKQQVTHGSYERIRNRLTSRSERRELEAFQQEVSACITAPGEVAHIPDYEERD